ncbi:ribose 5-phosphate isomerase B [Christensenellaceae bacterium OttesenSCG-928-K19]|nr:ribose 5-phosphate isomerase B [Christensenellaceae bacterium OttesenSCG-928-K19]
MKVVFGCDHGGIVLKPEIISHLEKKGIEVIDVGAYDDSSSDYPVFGELAARAVQRGEADFGIVVCGTGIGISITANKVPGIRCALVHDTFSAHATREHNDANMLAMGARVIGAGLALDIIDIFLGTGFSGEERHQRRIDGITRVENEQ